MTYTELHCHSGFSFLDGASSPDDLAAAAATQGYEALAITDHDGVWGAMEFAVACQPLGVRPIVGAEVTVALPVPDPVPGTGHRVTLTSRFWSSRLRGGGTSACF